MKRRSVQQSASRSSVVTAKIGGRSCRDWVALLHAAGAKMWSRTEIALWLRRRGGLSDDKCLLVADAYGEACGRSRPAKDEGFCVSVSVTIAVPVADAFAAWKDAALREKWLPGLPLTVRKATPHKSIRIAWPDGTGLSVNFWPKGALKCQVMPVHGDLPTAESAEKIEAFWTIQLEILRQFLESASA